MEVAFSKSNIKKLLPNPVSVDLAERYVLSEEQHRFYQDNGFLVIKDLIDFASLYNYKRRFMQMCNGLVETGSSTIVRERALVEKGLKGEDAINKISEVHYDEVFMTYTEHPKLLHVLSQLIGKDITVVNSMIINKPPGTGIHPPHQDLFYFPFRPADKIIGAWTAIDNVTRDNGCLFVLPRSHKRNVLYPHGHLQGANKLYHGILEQTAYDESQFSHLEMSPGDTVFFHPLIIHGSGPNVSKNYRKCVTAHYANSECQYIDVSGTVQEGVAREVEAEAKRRGFSLSFQGSFRLRNKHVLGVRSNL
ncbi:probable phytanoyl-CoA dioxygenase isoform X2 [Leptidea sinapis]|uniref:probable phytanoyl-CoA dioxygenase isoform X2 n=1 Tax=Leptidea sinapis TaxID=189913 RepID=UPI00212C508A|nr:probable phytanoyl-CoA dioxygenase isoform X2 [Leptidea sinapis]